MKKIYTLLSFAIGTAISFAQPCIVNPSSLSFNGTSAYVDLASATSLAPDSQVTVEAWINPTQFAASSYQNTIVGKDDWAGTAGEAGFVLRCGGNGILSFAIAGNNYAGVAQSWKECTSPAATLSLNTWTHVAGTFNGSKVRCFVNGVEVGSILFTGLIRAANAYPLNIGKMGAPSQSRYFKGGIDEVRVWKRALTTTELIAGMNDHINPQTQTGLIGYWRLNENNGTTTADLSNSNFAGTLSGATWNTSVPWNTGFTPSAISGSNSATPFVSYDYSIVHHAGNTYTWFATNGTIVLGTSSDTVSVMWNSAGTGQISVIESNGICTDTTNFAVQILPVGIRESSTNKFVSLTTNPVKDKAIFNFKSQTNCTVKIIDILGNEVSMHNSEGRTSLAINANNFTSGIYFYQITQENKIISTGKMIVE